MIGRLDQIGHLARRFVGHLRAEPPGPDDQHFVHEHLDGVCADLFWLQSVPDQRHAIDVARRVSGARPNDSGAVKAALLHDIGKAEANIGAVARSIATVLASAGLPMTTSMRTYREHGQRGAAVLEEADCGSLAVAFARYHPGPVPSGTDPARWKALSDADG